MYNWATMPVDERLKLFERSPEAAHQYGKWARAKEAAATRAAAEQRQAEIDQQRATLERHKADVRQQARKRFSATQHDKTIASAEKEVQRLSGALNAAQHDYTAHQQSQPDPEGDLAALTTWQSTTHAHLSKIDHLQAKLTAAEQQRATAQAAYLDALKRAARAVQGEYQQQLADLQKEYERKLNDARWWVQVSQFVSENG